MPALQVRDLPQDLYDKLKARAEREHRSLAQETIVAIERHVDPATRPDEMPARFRLVDEEAERQARIACRRRVLEEIAAMPPSIVPDDFPSPAELIREERRERDDRLGC